MERMMTLCMLRLESAKKVVVIRMITCQDKMIEVCKYQPIMEGLLMMNSTSGGLTQSGRWQYESNA